MTTDHFTSDDRQLLPRNMDHPELSAEAGFLAGKSSSQTGNLIGAAWQRDTLSP
jgi:hypothetical protein